MNSKPPMKKLLYFPWFTFLTLLIGVVLAPFSPVRAQSIIPIHTKLTSDPVSGGSFGRYLISPDGNYVVYLADQDTLGVVEIYSVPIHGGGVVKLNGAMAPGLDVYSFTISPNSSYVIFQVGESQSRAVAVYSVPITGGTPVNLTPQCAI